MRESRIHMALEALNLFKLYLLSNNATEELFSLVYYAAFTVFQLVRSRSS